MFIHLKTPLNKYKIIIRKKNNILKNYEYKIYIQIDRYIKKKGKKVYINI